jgi:hypothetical protein
MIRPVDLQAIYMNLDKVGKELSLTRTHVTNQQSLEAAKLLKIHDQEQNAVNTTQASEETGAEGNKIKSDTEGGAQAGKHHQPQEQQDSEQEPKFKDAAWTDPKLGHHVDITG